MKKHLLFLFVLLPYWSIAQLSNEEKALALIDAFETGDTLALSYISDSIYIQHNLAFPTGKAVLAGLITGSPTGFTTENFRIYSDGDFVYMNPRPLNFTSV